LSAAGDGHFGLVVRDEDSRAEGTGGGEAPVGEVGADSPCLAAADSESEPESAEVTGPDEAFLPSALSLLAEPFDPGSASPLFRTTVSC
jgi:hypothetical protein